MGCSKSRSKKQVYSNTTLPQEKRKTLNRKPNFIPKATGKKTTTTTTKAKLIGKRSHKDKGRNK